MKMLTSFDVANNTVLTDLRCAHNQLTGLDVTKNTALKRLDCKSHQLTDEGLNALFGTLPNHSGVITFNGNPGAAGCDKSIATTKDWTFL